MQLISKFIKSLTSKERWKVRLVIIDRYLSRPIVLVGILLVLFSVIGFYSTLSHNKLLEDTKASADNTAIIVEQLKKVLCEEIPDDQCNLSKAVAELKKDTQAQHDTLFHQIECLAKVSIIAARGNDVTIQNLTNCEFTAVPIPQEQQPQIIIQNPPAIIQEGDTIQTLPTPEPTPPGKRKGQR